MKKPAIPALLGVQDQVLLRLLTPIKENIEIINGTREGVIEKLPQGITDLPTIVSKINEIIERLNAHD